MNILITNDDGYDAEGISVLRDALKKAGHDVLELAPSENQSAKSHSLRISGEFELLEHGGNVYSIDGTPADTVIFYENSYYFPDFKADLVVSGINRGLNVSSDIIYSGTCGAAREASFRGYPAIAVSCQVDRSGGGADYGLAADFLVANLDSFYSSLKRKGTMNFFLNINVPAGGRISDFKYASLTPLDYSDVINEEEEIDGDSDAEQFRIQFTHNGIKVNEECRNKDSNEMCDMDAIGKGFISVTYVRSFLDWDNSGC